MLVIPSFDVPPRTFKELLESPMNYTLYNPGFPDFSAFANDLSTSTIPMASQLLKRLQDVNPFLGRDHVRLFES